MWLRVACEEQKVAYVSKQGASLGTVPVAVAVQLNLAQPPARDTSWNALAPIRVAKEPETERVWAKEGG